MLDQLARQLDVDVLVTGHSHQCSAVERNGRLFVDPGSATGAFSVLNDGYHQHYLFVAAKTILLSRPIEPSFSLMDVQADSIVVYMYRLANDDVKVDRANYKKQLD